MAVFLIFTFYGHNSIKQFRAAFFISIHTQALSKLNLNMPFIPF
ncbi:hypothetical protein J2T19_004108 [Paenibacillus tundrae]|uniref:Uncharacterized protein n=1 Tax=Paenibacillus tundrae TaxID=528187 RepID=A0ABT9WH76_9BACL|nr:hypothetical protein [Paenibacillus tundrae]